MNALPTKQQISLEWARRTSLGFARHFFPLREGDQFIQGPHHRIIGEALDRVLSGEMPRLIITLPPGYAKTEMAVVNFIARGFSINPGARFIHATFSDDLARENSAKIKELLQMPEFAAEWSLGISDDTRAKDRWKTAQGGGMLAKAAGGPITGFRAGRMEKGIFTGALVIDDPLKPDDAFSATKRATVNKRATNTFRSRLAHDDIPIVVIMQRLHSDDFAGHLLKGGSGDAWHHLDLPVMIEHGRDYPPEWTHGIPIEHDLPEGPLWPAKHSEDEIEILKADAYTFASQYMQRPVSVEGALFEMDKVQWYAEPAPYEWCSIYADTAQKTGERNDYSVFQLWAKGVDGHIWLLDQVRGKWAAPELEKTARAFWEKHRAKGPRRMNVEDKSSGTGLIQSLGRRGLNGEPPIPVKAIPRNKDKYTRGLDAAPYIATGMVHLPKDAPYTPSLRSELQTFDGLGTGHDDQCLVSSTLVETETGPQPIETIMVGQKVLTRDGYRKVAWSGMTDHNAEVVTAVFSNGATLTGTRGHPVWIEDRGFVCLDAVMGAGSVQVCTRQFTLPKVNGRHQKMLNTTSRADLGHARPHAVRLYAEKHRQAVYNLTVEGKPEFYANGILVHNCDPLMDAISDMLAGSGYNGSAWLT